MDLVVYSGLRLDLDNADRFAVHRKEKQLNVFP